MTSIAGLGYWPDAVIIVVGLVAIFVARRVPGRLVFYIAFGDAALLMLWIALRSYSVGDAFGFWLFIVLAVAMVLAIRRLADILTSLRRR
jgi:hypothetical protein